MANINNVTVIDRHNRPGVLDKVMLRAFFINNGALTDPAGISGVTVFTRAQNTTPSTVLTSAGIVSGPAKMGFSNGTSDVGDSTFNESSYSPGTDASGIYKLGTGEFAVVLDGSLALSGENPYTGARIPNTASAVGNYIDIWTVKLTAGSDWTTLINNFDLYDNTFVTVTEPLLLETRSNLFNSHVVLDSTVDLKVGNDITIANKGIDDAIQNIMKDSMITSGAIQIKKKNDGNNLSDYTVSAFADTSSTVDVTADNTLVFNWNTGGLAAIAANSGGQMGNIVGTYSIQAEFTLLNQKIRSEEMFVQVRL